MLHFIGLMMSKRMRDNLPYLQILAKCKPKVRKVLIEHGPSDLVLSICECCHNVLKGTVPLTKREKQHLSRYKKHLRGLVNKKISRVKKRRLLAQQKGGGNLLTALLPPVLSVLTSLLRK
jgi:hypothetical protein